jgi:hypothetical protein
VKIDVSVNFHSGKIRAHTPHPNRISKGIGDASTPPEPRTDRDAPISVTPLWRGRTSLHANEIISGIFY